MISIPDIGDSCHSRAWELRKRMKVKKIETSCCCIESNLQARSDRCPRLRSYLGPRPTPPKMIVTRDWTASSLDKTRWKPIFRKLYQNRILRQLLLIHGSCVQFLNCHNYILAQRLPMLILCDFNLELKMLWWVEVVGLTISTWFHIPDDCSSIRAEALRLAVLLMRLCTLFLNLNSITPCSNPASFAAAAAAEEHETGAYHVAQEKNSERPFQLSIECWIQESTVCAHVCMHTMTIQNRSQVRPSYSEADFFGPERVLTLHSSFCINVNFESFSILFSFLFPLL